MKIIYFKKNINKVINFIFDFYENKYLLQGTFLKTYKHLLLYLFVLSQSVVAQWLKVGIIKPAEFNLHRDYMQEYLKSVLLSLIELKKFWLMVTFMLYAVINLNLYSSILEFSSNSQFKDLDSNKMLIISQMASFLLFPIFNCLKGRQFAISTNNIQHRHKKQELNRP